MGVEPYMVANSLVGLVAQRLVRVVIVLSVVTGMSRQSRKKLL